MSTTATPCLQRLEAAPLAFRAYLVFATLATLLLLGTLFAPSFRLALIPYLGWQVSLFIHVFCLIPALSAVCTGRKTTLPAIIGVLIVGILHGGVDWYRHTLGDAVAAGESTNPYLAWHPVRPVFTVALPALWLILLLSPPVRRWFFHPAPPSDAPA